MVQKEISVKTTQPDAPVILDLQSEVEHQGVQIQTPFGNSFLLFMRHDVCSQGSQENVPSVHVLIEDVQNVHQRVHNREQDHIIDMPADRDEYINENYSRLLETERVFQSNDGRQGVQSSTGCIKTIFQYMRNLIPRWSMFYCRRIRRDFRFLKPVISNIYGYLRRYTDVEVQNAESYELVSKTISRSSSDISLDASDYDEDFQYPGYHTPLSPRRASYCSVYYSFDTPEKEFLTPPASPA